MEFFDALAARRTVYALDDNVTVSDEKITEIVEKALSLAPSAFNSQTSRAVVLFGEQHKKLWNIVLETLREVTGGGEGFADTEAKIGGFAAGHATVLFFEEQNTIKGLQEQFPSYAENFPLWSLQASGMAQLAVWAGLAEAGLGANLQHYNPLIDEKVAAEWNIPANWKLWAQMVVGNKVAEPGDKETMPTSERVLIKK